MSLAEQRTLAEQGLPEAQFELGTRYEDGKGVRMSKQATTQQSGT